MKLSETAAEKIISDMGMGDLPLVEIQPIPSPVAPDWFVRYKELCQKFLLSLTDSVDTLAFMNFSESEFMGLITAQSVPENISIRFRTPLVWGGKLETDNLFLCWTFPHSYNMDRFIAGQFGNTSIWMPNPTKKVYLPAHTADGGDGGNATEDRLAQMAAQLAAGRDM
ncbi:MAG: hypothetical protein IKL37_00670 [Alphaproteobacteria bacterium]|nr:hypothetical protein [Alphaproteobacteria bacterium]MBR6684760.1 hypothetical protein [Alphaproteobacteria bacterium]